MSRDAKGRRPEGPAGAWILGQALDFQRDPFGLLTGMAAEYGDVSELRLGDILGTLVVRPEHVKHVLQDRMDVYTKETLGWDRFRSVLGRGLLTADRELWRHQRRLLQPSFHRKAIERFAPIVIAETERMLTRWERRPASDAPVDMLREIRLLTITIISQTFLGWSAPEDVDRVAHHADALLRLVNERIGALFLFPLWVPTPANLRFRRVLGEVETFVRSILEHHRARAEASDDLVARLIAATDEETGERMGDLQLRDEVMTIFITGYETTANAISWALYLLATHPEVARELEDELDRVLGGRAPTLEDLEGLELLDRVIHESLRLYPPGWFFTRGAQEEDEIGGYRIPARSIVLLSPYLTHRHRDHWEDPERFDPGRFEPARSRGRPPFAFFPFGAGPRQCIGKVYALMNLRLVLAQVLTRFRLTPPPTEWTLAFDTDLTLTPRGGLPLGLRARGDGS